MTEQKTFRAISQLLSYPDEQTVESAELLYVILQTTLPEAAENLSAFGKYLDQHELWEVEEAFTTTFDVNPACALEVGWHLFGEEYARGMFLVRMREELRKYGLTESAELPDHMTHVLAVIGAMPTVEAKRFANACVIPAVDKMRQALATQETPYRYVVACLDAVLKHLCDWKPSDREHPDSNTTDSFGFTSGIDPLHAYPVADVMAGCGEPVREPEVVGEFVKLHIAFPHGVQEPQP